MRRIRLTSVCVLTALWCGVSTASSDLEAEVAEIKRLENARATALRNAMGVGQYHTSDYVGIAATGFIPPNSLLLQRGEPQRTFAVRDLRVQVVGDAGFSRGVQVGSAVAHATRFLRVWRKEPNGWKIAAFHATATGEPTLPTSPLRSLPKPLPSTPPRAGDESEAVKAHFALNAALAANDVAAIEALTAPDFVMVTPDGVERPRADAGIRRTVLIDAVRVRMIGNLAVVNYREIPRASDGALGIPALVTRVLAKSDAGWQARISQHTNIADRFR